MKFDYKIPRNVKQKWIRALRSGRYARGKGTLVSYNKANKVLYSVLGVAAAKEIAEPSEVCFVSTEHSSYRVDETFLPMDIQTFLMERNDGLHGAKAWSFNRMADWIAKNL